MSCCLDLRGPVDEAAFGAAVRQALDEAEGLRARFFDDGGSPSQEIHDIGTWKLPVHDFSTADDPEAAAETWMHTRRLEPFAADTSPLVDFALLRLSGDRRCWYVGYHQLVADGAGIQLFIQRAVEIYNALVAVEPASPAWFTSLRQFLADESGYPSSEQDAEARRYFSRRFADRPASLRLPAGTGPVARTGCAAHIDLTPEDVERLRAAAKRLGTRWFGLVAMSLAVHVGGACGTDDVVLSLAVHGRATTAARKAPTRIANVLPLRVSTAAELACAQLAAQVTAEIDNLRRHQRCRGEELRRQIMAGGEGMFFGPVLNLVPWERHVVIAGVTAQLRNIATITPSEDFSVYCYKTADGGLQLILGNPTGFDGQTLALHRSRLMAVLARMCDAQPDQLIGALDLITDDERTRLPGYRTTTAIPHATLPQMIKARAAQSPDGAAIESAQGEMTYATLDERAERLAGRLVAAGVGTGSRVAVLMARSAHLVVALLAVTRAGGAYVPLDSRNPPARTRAILDAVGARVLVVDEAHQHHVVTRGHQVVRADTDESADVSPPALPADPEMVTYVMHTSGSTGEPKGVAVTHRNVVALARDRAFAGPAHRRVLFHSPHAFDASTYEIWVPLLSGGTVVVAPADVDTLLLRRLLGDGTVTALWLTAGLFAAVAHGDPACLRGAVEVWAGGEALSAHAVRKVLDACPGLVVVNGYGPTETTTFATCHRVESSDDIGEVVPIGRPLDNTRVYVLDKALRPVPPGAVGQLYIGGAGVAKGYVGRPDLTEKHFRPDPFDPAGGRMYATGDRARWGADGTLQYLGRVDNQVKIRGFRVEPGDIEAALGAHPVIAHAAVVAEQAGDRTKLVAHLVVGGYPEPSIADLRAHLRRRLPDYMIPADFRMIERLPLTASGKVDRAALPGPDGGGSTGRSAPRRPGDEFLCALFAEILDEPEVMPDDDFFELGGHSLLANRLVGRIRQRFGIDVELNDVFAASTATQLADRLGLDRALPDGVAGTPPSALHQHGPDDTGALIMLPLASSQKQIWLAEKLGSEPGRYNIPLAWRVRGRLDPARVEMALARVIARHEVLRTSFLEVDGRLRQIVGPPWKPVLTCHRIDASADLAPVVRAEADRPFNLGTGPLLRAALMYAPEGQVLMVNIHHIVFDEPSLSVLLNELSRYYADPGMRDPQPPQYRHFVALRDRTEPAALERVVRRLRGAPSRLPMAVSARPGGHGVVPVPLVDDMLPRVRSLQRQRSVSWFMVAATAVAAVLHRYTGHDDVAFGFPAVNRGGHAFAKVIGPCLNSVVIRSRCESGTTFGQLLEATRERVLDALKDQDVPYDQVVQALNPPRTYGSAPYLDVVLAPRMTGTERFRLGAATLEPLPVSVHSASISKFALTVAFAVIGERMEAALDYRGDRFDRHTATELARMLGRALLAVAAEPERPVRSLEWPAEASPAPGVEPAPRPTVPVRLVGDLEERLAALWRSVLGRTEVGAHETFFDLGGDSLLLVIMHAKLRTELGVELPIQRLFDHATVHSLARAIAESSQPSTAVRFAVDQRAASARQARMRRTDKAGQ